MRTFFTCLMIFGLLATLSGGGNTLFAQSKTDSTAHTPPPPLPTYQWAIKVVPGAEIDKVAEELEATLLHQVGNLPRVYLIEIDSVQFIGRFSSIQQRLEEHKDIEWFERQYLEEASKRFDPTDPLFANQWHLRNTGQGNGTAGEDANLQSAWALGYDGSDININIIDDGVQLSHPDLIANRWSNPDEIPGNGIDDDGNGLIDDIHGWNFNGGNNNVEGVNGDNHGTACAGVASSRDNTIGGIGAAYRSQLAAIRLIAGGFTDAQAASALSYKSDLIHISSNSWGPADNGTLATGNRTLQMQALAHNAATGRDGKGTIFSWAAGNGLASQDNVNYDPLASSRFTIAVGATTNFGTQAGYSEPGASILVNAPSNGGSLGITTTDRVGTQGYNTAASPNGDYTSNFGGTSSACPLASGIIALMLQANPALTWRDVQHVLVNTSDRNAPNDGDWQANGAGRMVNHKFGFGRINAERAVLAALDWRTAPAYQSATSNIITVNQSIPDNNADGVLSTVQVNENLFVEHVEVVFSALHGRRGDLRVVLTSPDGTESVLAETRTTDNGANYSSWMFTSVRHWGERTQGQWSLRVSDGRAGTTGSFVSWQLILHGTETPAQPALIAPANNRSGLPTTIGFHWANFPEATSYTVEIATSATFSMLTTSATVSGTTTAIGSLHDETVYFWRVRANLPSTTSNWSHVRTFNTSQPAGASAYCVPTYTNPCSTGDFIHNFSFAGIVNNNTGCNAQANNYIYYSQLNANVTAGQTYSLSVQAGSGFNVAQGFAVWIDFNQDGNFTLDERVFTAAASANTQTGNVTIPLTALNGTTRMRVRSQWNQIPNSPCNNLNYGETEDYNITISGGASPLVEVGGYVVGDAFGGVQVSISGTTTASTTTGNDGFFSFVVGQGSYTLTPSLSGYSFSPTSQTVTITNVSDIRKNFLATQNATGGTYTISGAITGGQSLVTITLASQGNTISTATVSGSGTYSMSGVSNGSYTLTPSSEEYSFMPSNRHLVVAGGDITEQNFTVATTQIVPLQQGWNIVSSRVLPPAMALEAIITSANIFMVKDNSGATFIPSFGINAIGDWDITQGYQIHTTQATALTFTGAAASTAASIALGAGWNIASYLRSFPLAVEAALASIVDDVFLVKNNAGDVFIPQFGVNSLGTMLPGQGYQVNMLSPAALVYPLSAKATDETSYKKASPNRRFAVPTPSGNNATVLIASELPMGVEVAAISAEGNIIGAAVINGSLTPLTIWGEDAEANVQGASPETAIAFRLADAQGERPAVIAASEVLLGSISSLFYEKDALYLVELRDYTSKKPRLTLSPNPAGDEVNVSYYSENNDEAVIRLNDMAGREVLTLSAKLHKGDNLFRLNTAHLSSAVYLLHFSPKRGQPTIGKVIIAK